MFSNIINVVNTNVFENSNLYLFLFVHKSQVICRPKESDGPTLLMGYLSNGPSQTQSTLFEQIFRINDSTFGRFGVSFLTAARGKASSTVKVRACHAPAIPRVTLRRSLLSNVITCC